MRRYDICLAKEDQEVIIRLKDLCSVADVFSFLYYSLRPEKGSFANPLDAKLVLSVAICRPEIFDWRLTLLFIYHPSILLLLGWSDSTYV